MASVIPIFRPWVPEWLIKIILFSVLLPSLVLFFLPLANIQAAAGFYGSEPADMQFAVALFYSGYVGFYSLERRFFNYLAAKEYFLLFTSLLFISTLACYFTNELYIFFPIRFIQGILFACTVNLSLSLIFTRLRSERAREISFSVFFGMLLCTLPFNYLVTADLIDNYNYNVVYKGALFSYIPCLVLLPLAMNRIRLNVRFPLHKLDWQSFAIYSCILVLLGYVMIYGQEYYWLGDVRILFSVIGIALLTLLTCLRQWAMKRPYIDLHIFRSRNFWVGSFVLFVMYICRFASGLMNGYFSSLLGFDPMHISYINIFNLLGLVTGIILSCCMILQKKRIRAIWVPGFIFLLAFQIMMFYHFDVQANEYNYFLPLFMQGLGVGMIMVPTIVFTIASVSSTLGPSAAAICLAVRYLGFCVSIALINYFELYGKSKHFNTFQEHLSSANPEVLQHLQTQSSILQHKGLDRGKAVKGAYKILTKSVNTQGQLRFAMDYYELMAWLILGTLLLIILFPYLNKTVVYLRSKKLSPA